jgi:hypothetical protein
MIEKREKRKKIFYVPGMISLIFIPLFCFYHFYKVDAFKVEGGINLVLPYKDVFDEYKVATIRKYKVFEYNGGKSEEKTLKEMKFFLRKLQVNKDTLHGIRMHFGSEGTYRAFINSVDILIAENAPTWTIRNNDIYVLGTAIRYKEVELDKKSYRMNCGTAAIIGQEQLSMLEYKRAEEKRDFQMSFFKHKWIILSLGYFGLVFLNNLTLVKFNKNR